MFRLFDSNIHLHLVVLEDSIIFGSVYKGTIAQTSVTVTVMDPVSC